MRNILIILSILFLASCSLNRQSNNKEDTSPYKDTLIDKSSGIKFYLDTLSINIYAFDKEDKLLWKTDPWKDNKLMEYRVKRPKIVYFNFVKNEISNNIEVIGIAYNNSQFGHLDKLTGKFIFGGQD